MYRISDDQGTQIPKPNFDVVEIKRQISVFTEKKKKFLLELDKIAYSRKKGCYMLFLRSEDQLSVKDYNSVKKELLKDIPELKFLKIIIQQDDMFKNEIQLADHISEFIAEEEPAMTPFILNSRVTVEGNTATVTFAHDSGPQFAKMLNIAQRTEEYFYYTFGREIRIGRYAVDPSLENEPRTAPEKREELTDEELISMVREERKKAPKKSEKRIPRRKEEQHVTKLSELQPEESGIIEGLILETEVRPTREGKSVIFTCTITDYTSTIYCQRFERKPLEEFEAPLKAGDHCSLEGNYSYNSFKKEYIWNIRKITVLPPYPKRQDIAQRKRVELHLHTHMSAQDGLTDVREYVSTAARWGHKAIAVTDHGVVQAFPFAGNAGRDEKIKIIYGVEANMVDAARKVYEGKDHSFDDEFVVFDIETTGLSREFCEIIEIGGVKLSKGRIIDRFQAFVKPSGSIPADIIRLTGITDAMVEDAEPAEKVLKDFLDFAGDDCLIAHNADFDTGFIFKKARQMGIEPNNDVLDTLMLARVHITDMRSRSLDKLAQRYGVPLKHHRAVNDAEATALIFVAMLNEIKQKGFTRFSDLNYLADTEAVVKTAPHTNHITILCRNKEGLVNLYKLISLSHLKYFRGKPRLPKGELISHREGLLFGTACFEGELYEAAVNGDGDDRLKDIMSFYDYVELQPVENYSYQIKDSYIKSEDDLRSINRRIYRLAKEIGKPVVATGDAHFLDPEDILFRKIVLETANSRDENIDSPLYFRTTDEMLDCFSYLGSAAAEEVVIDNTNLIADEIEEINLFPGKTAMPFVENSDEEIREIAIKTVKELYGDPIPSHIEERLFKELNNIIDNGFGVLYWSAMKLVKKSMSDGYLVGSRGSVGSSFAAFAMGITEVNPLKPHYRCPKCRHSDFNIDPKYACGPDMPEAYCPVCGEKYISDGYDIPFEVFLGLHAEKVPDIDLNFSGDYRTRANKYVEELFGPEYVFRAGTISAIKHNIAAGLVRKYMQAHEETLTEPEIERLATGMEGVKKTTGQHPGGLVIVPRGHEIYEYTPIQKPANKEDAETVTTHFDFNSMHDILIKLDILGHDNPTIIRIFQELTGIDPLTINVTDEKVISLFTSTDALGVRPDQINGIELGVLGLPEFGTHNTMKVLKKTRPSSMGELIRISGLTHGTDVWGGNAETLIETGVTTLNSAICTRDDIMLTLVNYGVDHQLAFFIMESVRKGKWAKGKEKDQANQEKAMREAGVPEWFIESCRKIQYMFPKAHAVAYVLMALRIAYFKVYYPTVFYAGTFSIKISDFDALTVMKGIPGIEAELKRLEDIINQKKASKTEKDRAMAFEIALEMLQRGVRVLPPDLMKSRAERFTVEGDAIRMPFIAIPSLGEKAAELIEQKRSEMEFTSIEEVQRECKLSQTVVDAMRQMGVFGDLSEKAQMSLFDSFMI
ncbi:MAG: PolC-type DNA polymerase III [Clostridia bacterium]|nr:PolC-type DNA polymerase III [Clostridia bacterium]